MENLIMLGGSEAYIVGIEGAVIVASKPQGLAVKAAYMKESLTSLIKRFSDEPNRHEYMPVSLFPKDVSGLILGTTNQKDYLILNDQIVSGKGFHIYAAQLEGVVDNEGVIKGDTAFIKEINTIGLTGGVEKGCRTEYRRVGLEEGVSLVLATSFGGGPAQTRLHFDSIGHPVVGDNFYGASKEDNLKFHTAGVSFYRPDTLALKAFFDTPQWLPKEIDLENEVAEIVRLRSTSRIWGSLGLDKKI